MVPYRLAGGWGEMGSKGLNTEKYDISADKCYGGNESGHAIGRTGVCVCVCCVHVCGGGGEGGIYFFGEGKSLEVTFELIPGRLEGFRQEKVLGDGSLSRVASVEALGRSGVWHGYRNERLPVR